MVEVRHRAAIPVAADWADRRLAGARPLRTLFNKVFPDHWSFMLGEIALYSFVVLLLTGTFLALFFTPSSAEVVYHGSYLPLRGVRMSAAYASSLDLSFDVRGGLILRQIHHWSALLFMAAIVVHMLRTFFTGAFRRPRELNWMVGFLLFWLGFTEGLLGYSLPDDALSGTGLRIVDAIIMSIPVVGSWISFSLFGGEFPGTVILERFYILHVFVVPGIILGLIALHLALLVKQKHTQWPGPGRTEHNVVGHRMFPGFAAKGGGFFMIVFGVLALLGGLIQINPVWLFGPYQPAVVSSASQPDWYVMFLDGSVRLFPAWELRFSLLGHGYTVPAVFFAGVPPLVGMLLGGLLYPFADRRLTRDRAHHNLLQRPRDVPARTGLGAMAVTFWLVLTLSAGNDVIADKFHVSLNAMTWAGRIALLVAPPLAYWLAYRICLGLQQHDREVLAQGVETGIITRLPNGAFVEVHQPLADGDEPVPYRGWAVPKKPNRIGVLDPPVKGFFVPVQPAPDEPAPAELTGSRR
ncbi:cytochrome bc1 complex cytochrome b subunit [Actinocatenispora sera]|uniref:cytochrome bc1 complex cytochrome b subunit n=1 Tax=Actinocatenispora sera TaxID=390989 RepID=UPI003F4CEEA4